MKKKLVFAFLPLMLACQQYVVSTKEVVAVHKVYEMNWGWQTHVTAKDNSTCVLGNVAVSIGDSVHCAWRPTLLPEEAPK